MGSVSVCTSVDVDVDVDIDLKDIIHQASPEELAQIALAAGFGGPELAAGDGDASRVRNIVAAAERALRAMPDRPRELEDLFWHVHGVAL